MNIMSMTQKEQSNSILKSQDEKVAWIMITLSNLFAAAVIYRNFLDCVPIRVSM